MLPKILIAFFLVAASHSVAFADDVPDQAEGKVVKVEAGDVLVVQLDDKRKRVKVRILGIDCSSKARGAASKMLGRDRIVLRSDKGFLPILQDQLGRYVAYVQMKDGRDLGLELLRTGKCSSEDWKIRHPRAGEYDDASN